MLATGNQLKAARALAGVDQQQVADAAGVNVNTIRNMEARGGEPITSSAVIVRKVQLALEALGIEFLNHTQPGELVYEPFSGSGTTLVAAETVGRVCCAMELDPQYADVAVQRWQQLTGQIVTLESTGRSFVETAQERGKAVEN